MCRHVLNSQVYIQSPCCKKWFECSECHDENVVTHSFKFAPKLRFVCKNCRSCFFRHFKHLSERDKQCPVCGNRWILPGVTQESKMFEEVNVLLQSYIEEISSTQNPYFDSFDF
mmetsp:Transcript_4030/g.6245  ORF Transcript_4030/g.6245 Transcript_4030/m.6245 type:complete len:114 (-) Transcript_4030:60-401(-)